MLESLKIIVTTHTATRAELHEALGSASFRAVVDEMLTAALNEALDRHRGERLRVPAEFRFYYFRIAPGLAAAPDLLAALEKIVNHWDDLHPKDRQQARAALAAARVEKI